MTRHRLRSRCRPVLPGVYVDNAVEPTLQVRTRAAWLWSKRQGIVGGPAASALLGAKWVDPGVDVDLYFASTRPPPGVRTHHDRLHMTEHERLRGMTVTTAARTAFDLARRVPTRRTGIGPVVAAVDALLNATRIGVGDVGAVARQHPGVRGLRQVDEVLRLVDVGAESPKETWLRLLIRRHGFPPVQTQSRFATSTAALSPGSTWAGQISKSPSSTTATSTAGTAANTSGTCAAEKSWIDWAGSSSAWWPRISRCRSSDESRPPASERRDSLRGGKSRKIPPLSESRQNVRRSVPRRGRSRWPPRRRIRLLRGAIRRPHRRNA